MPRNGLEIDSDNIYSVRYSFDSCPVIKLFKARQPPPLHTKQVTTIKTNPTPAHAPTISSFPFTMHDPNSRHTIPQFDAS